MRAERLKATHEDLLETRTTLHGSLKRTGKDARRLVSRAPKAKA